MSKTRRMSQRRKRNIENNMGTFIWKTVTIPNLRFNSEKIKKFQTIEHKYKDILKQRKGNVANFVTLPPPKDNVAVIQKEVYMSFITRNYDIFSKADTFYNQKIRELGGTVVNDKDIKATFEQKKKELKEKQHAKKPKSWTIR